MGVWRKYTQTLKLNDEVFPLDKIDVISENPQTPLWQKQYYNFIQSWIKDDDYLVVNTSGSTGSPKPLRIHKDVFVFSALNTGKSLGLSKGNRALLCLPGSYIAGKMMIVRAFTLGLNLHWQKPSARPDINTGFDFAAMTPMQIQNILEQNKISLDNIDKLIVGGAPVNDYILNNITDLHTKIFETYGMTETVSHIALKQLTGKNKSGYFSVLPEIAIDKDKRNCLMITSKKLQVRNLQTNDIVEIISPEKFKWLGRIDNIINSGGIKLIPEQIEAKIKHLITDDFFVFGIKDDLLTQAPAILIEGKGHIDTKDMAEVLSKYEIPKQTFYLNRFVRTESGKIKRKETIDLLS